MQRAFKNKRHDIGHREGTLSPPFSSLLLFLPPSFPLLFLFFFFKNSNENWSHLSKVSASQRDEKIFGVTTRHRILPTTVNYATIRN